MDVELWLSYRKLLKVNNGVLYIYKSYKTTNARIRDHNYRKSKKLNQRLIHLLGKDLRDLFKSKDLVVNEIKL
jgi:hypothetical protein